MMKSTYLYLLIFTSILFAVDPSIKNLDSNVPDRYRKTNTAKIGDYPFPTNPMSDRAKGFIDQGRVKTAIANYGSFINWDFHPSGIWGDYSYLPAVSFIAGVPGNKNTNNFNWTQLETVVDEDGVPLYSTWSSTSAYDDWYPASGDTVYKGIIFELDADDGLYLPENEKFSLDGFDNDKQFFFDHEN